MEKLKDDYMTAPTKQHSKRSAAAALEEQLTLADYRSSEDNETLVQSSGTKVAPDLPPNQYLWQ